MRRFVTVLATAMLLTGCSGGVSAAPPPTTTTEGSIPVGSTVTFVGDSIVHGWKVGEAAAWPSLVGEEFGWNSVNLGCDGGGFIATGSCNAAIGDRAADIAATDPDVIVISTSRNDLGLPAADVLARIAPAVDAIHAAAPEARILGVSNVWGAMTRPAALDDYNTALADAVNAVGGSFLGYADPLRGDAGLMQADGVHPTAEGQRAIAGAFEAAARGAGLSFG